MNTIGDVVRKIQGNIDWFFPNESITKRLNEPLVGTKGSELLTKRIDDICKVYNDFVINEQMNEDTVNVNLNRLLTEEGMVYEALGYYWLMQTSISPFLTPLYTTSNNIYGKDVELDGCIDDCVAFDIKKFQNYSEILSGKLNELNRKYTNYVFMPARQTDLSKEHFFDNAVIKQIEDAIKKGKQSAQIILPNQGTILMKKTERINMSESVGNPFLWCQNNYKSFLSDCHQFTIDKPFLLIEVADLEEYDMKPIGTYMLLRTMIRRTFFELSNVIDSVSEYDKKVNDGCSVGEAMKYLSAIMFVDINSGRSFAFINPFATNKMKRNYFEYYSWDNQITVDDFDYDSY